MIREAAKTIARQVAPIDRLIRQRTSLSRSETNFSMSAIVYSEAERLRQKLLDESESPPPYDRREPALAF
jgi:hypothetical protein